MAIYDHQYGGLDYLRVYRSWGGKEFQEYIRIKDSRAEAMKLAKEIEARLEQEYQEHVRAEVARPDYHVRKDGSIRGVRRVLVERANRAPSDVFELRINVPWKDKVKRTTVAISVHGFEHAFEQVIERVCGWYELPVDGEVAQAMRACGSHYQTSKEAPGLANMAISRARSELDHLAGGFVRGLKRLSI